MSSIESDIQEETEVVIEPIEQIYIGNCESLSARSVLTFAIGRNADDATLHLRIVRNSGSGMACTEWASAADIQSLVIGVSGLTAKSFHALHPGKSINTGGFVLAVLRSLGLIRANEENTRLHEHVPTTTFQQVAMARIAESKEQESKPGRKKGKTD